MSGFHTHGFTSCAFQDLFEVVEGGAPLSSEVELGGLLADYFEICESR